MNDWHKWFAWHPVQLPTGWAWLRTVERRRISVEVWTPIAFGYFDCKEVPAWEWR